MGVSVCQRSGGSHADIRAAHLSGREERVIKLVVNRQEYAVDVHLDTPLLWVLRETLGLTGTKFGCEMALCGTPNPVMPISMQ